MKPPTGNEEFLDYEHDSAATERALRQQELQARFAEADLTSQDQAMNKHEELATTAALTKLINRPAIWNLPDGVHINVRVLDARQLFGRTVFLVEPTQGEGQRWVRQENLTWKSQP